MKQLSSYSAHSSSSRTHALPSSTHSYAPYITMLVVCLTMSINSLWGDVTDNITVSDLAATNTTYTDFSDVAKTSNARYAGNSAKGNSVIRLRSSNSSGLVSTTSGGIIKSISITWDSNTEDEQKIDVYGSNSPYTNAGDLYASATQGILLGSIIKGTSTTLTLLDDFLGEFQHIGLRDASGGKVIHVSQISITWTTQANITKYELLTDISDLSAGDKIIILNTDGTSALSTTQNTNNRSGVATAVDNWSISGTTVTLGASTTVDVIFVGERNDHVVLFSSTGYLFAPGSSSTYQLKTSGTPKTDATDEWIISLNGSYEASIVAQGENDNKTMQFNSNAFSCYGSASKTAVKIYKGQISPQDYFIDIMHDNVVTSQSDTYNMPDIDNEDEGSTYEVEKHYVFIGWVEESDINSDGTLKSGYTLHLPGSSKTADYTTYYAVWGKDVE